MPGAVSTARPAPAGPPGAPRCPGALTGGQAARTGDLGGSLGAACGRFSFCSSMAAAAGTAARSGAGRARGPPLGGGAARPPPLPLRRAAALPETQTAAPTVPLRDCCGRVHHGSPGSRSPAAAPLASCSPHVPPELLQSSLLVLRSRQLSGSSGRAMGKKSTGQTPRLCFHVPLPMTLTAQGILKRGLGHPWGVVAVSQAPEQFGWPTSPPRPGKRPHMLFPISLNPQSTVGCGGWHETHRNTLGLLTQDKAKGGGLSDHPGPVNFPLVLPTALEHSPSASSEISLLSLSNGGQHVCGTH